MDILINFFAEYGYWAVFFVLVICGFGVPIPEDITLVSGGVIAGLYSEINVHLMFAVSLAGVIIGDSTMFWLGRLYGAKILRFRPLKKILTLKRLRMVREKFAQYGNWVLFFARFLPGLRAAIYVVAGITRKVSYTRFVILDLLAAIISVPVWVYLGHFGATNRDWLQQQIEKGQFIVWSVIGVVILFVLWKWWKGKKQIP